MGKRRAKGRYQVSRRTRFLKKVFPQGVRVVTAERKGWLTRVAVGIVVVATGKQRCLSDWCSEGLGVVVRGLCRGRVKNGASAGIFEENVSRATRGRVEAQG